MHPSGLHCRVRSSGSFFWESIFIDQATLNGTRPNSPVLVVGVKPAMSLLRKLAPIQPGAMSPGHAQCQWRGRSRRDLPVACEDPKDEGGVTGPCGASLI
jgi:hypothetical protein